MRHFVIRWLVTTVGVMAAAAFIPGIRYDTTAALIGAALLLGILNAFVRPVLLILGARFQRVSWKYASIAYSLTLKHVGVLYQTMYLVATAMGLAPCGVGCGVFST